MKEFSFKKNVLLVSSVSLVALIALVLLVKTVGTNLSASVLQMNNLGQATASKAKVLQLKSGTGNSCNDTDGGKNYSVKWIITVFIDGYSRTEQDTCNTDWTLREWFCGNPWEAAGLLRSENYVTCPKGCGNWVCVEKVNCNAPENVLACSLGLSSCPPECKGTWTGQGYGYGYGYRSTGNNNGYGYGYGYKKIDLVTKKPYIYLINVFKQYSKSAYEAVINKIGFQMVKSYNKKEFAPANTSVLQLKR